MDKGVIDPTAEDILLPQEFFHYIESQQHNSIYTQTERIELWRKPFSNRSCITAFSEVAAMAFAKEYHNLAFCPFALDTLMLYLYDKNEASDLYDEIMEEWSRWNST